MTTNGQWRVHGILDHDDDAWQVDRRRRRR